MASVKAQAVFMSQYIGQVYKNDPADATITSHKLMLRTSMIQQVTSGIYTWLPMGLRVLDKIINIVKDEMNQAGGLEMLMPCMQPLDLWIKSGRFAEHNDEKSVASEMLIMEDRHERKLVFTPTAEELFTQIIGEQIKSYKDLNKVLYQISWKFRDEIRPRFGVMRAREFLMKDAYSISENMDASLNIYDKMLKAYVRVFRAMGLSCVPVTASSGSMGGNHSHEFHILAKTGESKIFYDPALMEYMKSEDISTDGLTRFYAAEEDKHNERLALGEVSSVNVEEFKSDTAIEVGHIFYFGDKYTKSMGMRVQGKDGKLFYPHMGSYGIGVSRLVGAIIEASHDERGIIWPHAVAPFNVCILNLSIADSSCCELAESLMQKLAVAGVDVICDDTSDSPGAKFSKADLMGFPLQIIIGNKNLTQGFFEFKNRTSGKVEHMYDGDAAVDLIINIIEESKK